MRNKIFATLVFCLLVLGTTKAQNPEPKKVVKPKRDAITIGLGTGLDYAGTIGIKLNFQMIEHLGFYLAAARWDGGTTTALGLKLRLLPKPLAILCPYITGTYGSTEVLYIQYYTDDPVYNRGISLGGGFDLFNKPNSAAYLSLGASYALSPQLLYFTAGLNINLIRAERDN